MRKLVILVIWITSLLHGTQEWKGDLESALKEAKGSGKRVVVLVESKQCRWCKKLKAITLKDTAVISVLKPYIKVIVDQSDKALVKRFKKIDAVPTLLFLDANGTLLFEELGYLKPTALLDTIAMVETIDKEKKKEAPFFLKEEKREKRAHKLHWIESLQEGIELAKKRKRPLLIKVYEPECRWCKKMDQEIESSTRVNELLSKMVLVKVRRSQVESKKIEEFEGSIPSFFFYNADGELIDYQIGYTKADAFYKFLNAALNDE